jgi:hypothetical protein
MKRGASVAATTPTTRHDLPGRLVNFEAAREKHDSRADFLADMFQMGDPLADGVIS